MTRRSGQPRPFALHLVLLSVLFTPCTLAAAPERSAIEAMVVPSFAKDLVALLLPLIFTGVSSEANSAISLSLVDTVYCKTEDRSGAMKFLGILYPGEIAGRRIAPLLREEDCRGAPPTILKRLIAGPDTPHWLGFVELDVKWTPWQVQFTPTKLQALAKSQHPKVDVRLPHGATKVYPTSFTIPAEHGKAVPAHVAFGMAGTAFVVNGLIMDTPPTRYVPTFTEKAPDKLPSGANAMIAIPHAVANTILTQYLASDSYAIQLIHSAPALTVKDPVMTGSRNRYLTTALLGLREYPDAFKLDAEWSGDDLRLGSLSLTPRHTACGSDVVCQVKRAGLDALATSLTRLLRAQYKDIPLRSVILQDTISVKVNDRDVRVRADVLRAESTATALMLYTTLKLDVP